MIRLLCTDLDRTLLPNGAEIEPPRARERLAERVQRDGLLLAYVTGRDERLVREAVRDYALPAPDFVLADAGTEFLIADGEVWHADPAWQQDQRNVWQGQDAARVSSLLDEMDALQAQDVDRQRPFKRSYVAVSTEGGRELESELTQRLEEGDLSASVLFSHDPLTDQALIDVVPTIATKCGAVHRLAERLGYSLEQVLYAGDSGNDLDALVSDLPGVLVGNADEDTRARVRAAIRDGARADRMFEARAAYAGGILEGLDHYAALYSSHA